MGKQGKKSGRPNLNQVAEKGHGGGHYGWVFGVNSAKSCILGVS